MTPNPKARSHRRGWLLVVVLTAATLVWAVTRGEMTIATAAGIALVGAMFGCVMAPGDEQEAEA
jgi:hypothetical protein